MVIYIASSKINVSGLVHVGKNAPKTSYFHQVVTY
jgi:hypothetical protein